MPKAYVRLLPFLGPWAMLAGFGLYLRAAWPELPARVADHFSAGGAANGWSSRGNFAGFALGITLLICVALTSAGMRAAAQRPAGSYIGFCAIFYAATGFLIGTHVATIAANLHHHGLSFLPGLEYAAPAGLAGLGLGFLAARAAGRPEATGAAGG